MTKFRTHTYDAPEPVTPKRVTPGGAPANRIPIVDHKGRARGHVGPKATAATVSRFFDGHGSALAQHNGRTVWKEKRPSGEGNKNE